ncbi:MAG: tetratricopeptide repeat protein [Candidatus Thorarchaeota archaeon]
MHHLNGYFGGIDLPANHRERLSDVENMMQRGDYVSALQLVSEILSDNEVSKDGQFQAKLVEIRAKIKLGKNDEIDPSIDEAEKLAGMSENPLDDVEILLLKLEMTWKRGLIDEGLLKVKEIEKILGDKKQKLTDKDRVLKLESDMLKHQGILFWYKGDLDLAKESLSKSLELCESRNDVYGISLSYNNLGLVLWTKGDLDGASEYYEKALVILEQIGNRNEHSTILNNLGNVYMLKGEVERGYESYQQSLKIREEIGNIRDLATTLTNLGTFHQMTGDLNQAQTYYLRAIEYYNQMQDLTGTSLCFNNLGSINQTRGELDIALEYFSKSLEIRQKQDAKADIALTFINIGETEKRKGNLDEAKEFYQEGLAIYEEIGNEVYIATTQFYLIILAFEMNQVQDAEDVLDKLENLNSTVTNPRIDQQFRVAKAISLKSGKSARNKLAAQEILSEIVEEEMTDHSLTTLAMIHLCELLLFELKMSDDNSLLIRINGLAEKLIEIGKDQGSFTLHAKTNILRSKIALIEGDIEKARILLAQAHITAQEKGLHLLARKITHERDLLQSQIDKWENIIKKSPSKQEMADMANLDEFLERMIRKTVSVLSSDEKKYMDDNAIKSKYTLEYLDLLKESTKSEIPKFRVGIVQMGLSDSGDIVNEYYEELGTGLLGIKSEKINTVQTKLRSMVERASENEIKVLLFPEMTIDLNHPELLDEVVSLAKEFDMYIIPGSYHYATKKQNISKIITPEGIAWEQDKHIPAIIHFAGKRFTEGIDVSEYPRKIIVCNTEYGRIAIAICRDFLDMDLRAELKNFEPPIDLVLNPAFTPVTADFKAAHFDARRSIYAYCCFANVAEFGDSIIHSPEKDRTELVVSKGEEGLIFKDVDLFQLRAERKKWESIQKKQRPFIQSTRL